MKDIIEANLTIHKGSTYTLKIREQDEAGENVDLSAWDGSAHIREYPEADSYEPFTVAYTDGEFVLTLTPVQTHGLPYSRGCWDFFLDNHMGERVKIAQGSVEIIGDVTR